MLFFSMSLHNGYIKLEKGWSSQNLQISQAGEDMLRQDLQIIPQIGKVRFMCFQYGSLPVKEQVGKQALLDEGLLRQLLDHVDAEVELLQQTTATQVWQGVQFVAPQAAGEGGRYQVCLSD